MNAARNDGHGLPSDGFAHVPKQLAGLDRFYMRRPFVIEASVRVPVIIQ
jgi:hypothetical protein